MSKRTYVLEIEIEVDDEDDDLLVLLDKAYMLGRMQKVATNLVAGNIVCSEGYKGLGTVIANRKGLRKIKGQHVDHLDRNGGNNKRDNIAVVSISRNMKNRSNSAEVVSQFVGVGLHKRTGGWRYSITLPSDGSGRGRHVGTNLKSWTQVDAALAYNAKVIELGLDKPLNSIPGYTDDMGVPLNAGASGD